MRRYTRPDEGFTVFEVVIAVSLLAVFIVMSIQPIASALDKINRARLLDAANVVADQQLDRLRAMPFEELGYSTPGSIPEGSLPSPNSTIIANGLTWDVVTAIQYQGSLYGNGDGVPGQPDTGVDYKFVQVTVSHPDGRIDPVIQQAIMSPQGPIAAGANIRVLLEASEPAWAPSAGTPSWPSVYLYNGSRTTFYLPPIGSTGSDTVLYPQVDPNDPSPTDPDFNYYATFSVATSDVTVPDPTHPEYYGNANWFMVPDDRAKGIHVAPTETGEHRLALFKPVTIELRIEDDATGTLIPDATVTVTNEDTGDSATFTDADPNMSGGILTITDELDGFPLMFGEYTFSATAPGYWANSATEPEVPSAYPVTTHNQVLGLEALPAGIAFADIEVRDNSGRNVKIMGATVTVEDGGLPFSTGITDPFGKVTLPVPTGSFDWDIVSPWGHADLSGTSSGDFTAYMGLPGGFGYHVTEADGTGTLRYRIRYSGDPYLPVISNGEGEVSLALPPAQYQMRFDCDGGPTYGDNSEWVSNGGVERWSGPPC